jgi:hypothetical protein
MNYPTVDSVAFVVDLKKYKSGLDSSSRGGHQDTVDRPTRNQCIRAGLANLGSGRSPGGRSKELLRCIE